MTIFLRRLFSPFNIWIGFLGLLILAGLGAGLMVFTQGLVVTNLTDQVPWGLWITMDLSSIAVAAGAFSLSAAVYILGLKQLRPVARVAAFVGLEVSSLLMNEAPPLALRAAIRTAVDEDPAVEHVLNLVAVVIGSDRLMVALQVKFREQPSGTALVAAINSLERSLHARFPQIQHLFVEPDEA